MSAHRIYGLVGTAFTFVCATHLLAAQRPAKTTVESQVLLIAEPGMQYAVSAKGQHVAAVVLRGSRQVMVHDGVDGPRFDEILPIGTAGNKVLWSDDGGRFIYFGRVGQEYAVVVDGREVHRGAWVPELVTYGKTPVNDLGFTPRGKHWYAILYSATTSRQNYQLVIDGKPGPVSQDGLQPVWSPDGEHHAYIQKIFPTTAAQASYVLIVDGKPAPYSAGEPQFTTDGLHLFTKRQVRGTSLTEVLADGQPFMRAESVQLHMSPSGPGVLGVVWASPPNGARVSFLAVGNRKVPGSDCTDNAGLSGIYMSSDAKHFAARCRTWIMADAKKGQEYADGVSNVAFTADGKAVYVGKTNGKSFLIVGDQESDGYGNIIGPSQFTREQRNTSAFEPAPAVIRGNKIGYITRTGQGGNETIVVVEGKKIPALNATHLTLSPDGSRYAFLAGHPYQQAVVDGTVYSQMNVDIGVGNIGHQGSFQWTPDSKHVAWLVAAPTPGVAIDGKYIAAPGMTRFLKFTADGKHLVWIVRAAPGHVVFVDGEKVLELPQNLPLENEADIYWSFPEDGSIVFVAQDGDAMKRFKITPGSETSVETALAKAK